LGVTQRPALPKVDAKKVARTVARLLGVRVATLRGRRRGAELGRVRELVMLVGVEACGLKVKDLAVVIGRDPGSASRLYGQATTRRREDPGYAALAQQVVEALRRHERVRDDAQ
jgi:chromosomal replication initiation ATPase DnaA